MSDDFYSRMGGVMAPEDMQQLGGAAGAIMPDFDTNRMYAPSNWSPGPSSYTPISTTTFGDHGAQDLNARLIREQFNDYQRRFAPIEDMAVGLLTDTGTKDLPGDLARTRETIGGVFGSIEGQQGRAMERFGQTNTAKNITGSNAEAGALVGGLNTATFADEERRMKMLGGGSSSAATVVRGGGEGN
jgi:hypothetical protein